MMGRGKTEQRQLFYVFDLEAIVPDDHPVRQIAAVLDLSWVRSELAPHCSHTGPVAINVLDQDFTAEAPNEKWGVDISYVWTAEGWLYLAIVLDLFSRKIVGWAMSDRMKKSLAMEALQRALTMREPEPGLIHHSDRGSQYCSGDYQKLVARHGLVASMSGRGNCYDNAMVETVFKTIKSELIWRTAYASRWQASNAIGQYIEGFYNPRRRHSSLGYMSPAAFETTFHANKKQETAALH
jgi:putative transposase